MDEIMAIYPPAWQAMQPIIEAHQRGVTVTREQAAERAGLSRRTSAPPAPPGVAVIPLVGFLSRRPGLLAQLFGASSLDTFTAAVRQAAEEPSVGSILVLIDSPGGEVSGTPEAARAVYDARQRKRVTAMIDGLGASAAFWIAAQATSIVASPSSLAGSLGVVAAHVDESAALERAGKRVTIITSAKRKAEGNSAEPLGAEARAFLQARVDDAGAMFTADVARGRRVPVETARGPQFGEGRAFFAADAQRRGLIDQVATVQDVLARELSSRHDAQQRRAYDHALAIWVDLTARGIACARPPRPTTEDAARFRLLLAERGLDAS